jgi:hypothetical protein
MSIVAEQILLKIIASGARTALGLAVLELALGHQASRNMGLWLLKRSIVLAFRHDRHRGPS